MKTSLLTVTFLVVTAWFTHYEDVGLNRICFYKYLSSGYAMTLNRLQICPRSIEIEI